MVDLRVAGTALGMVLVCGSVSATTTEGERELGGNEALLADASARQSLQNAGSAGWDNGFKFSSGDGNYALQLYGGLQFRYVSSFQDESANGAEDTALGFENTRTRLGAKGHIIDPTITYNIWHGFTGSGSSLLLDAWMQKKYDKLTVRVGQFKLPTWQEWTVSEMRQQFVERSVLDARFSQLYSQGVMATWTEDDWRVMGALSDGLRSWNDNSLGTQFGVTGRAEYKWAGDWSQRSDFNSFRDEQQFGVVGAAFHYQDGASAAGEGSGAPFIDDAQVYQFTVDTQVGYGGWGLAAAFIGNFEENPGGNDYDQYGVLVQGSYFVTDDWELIARYEWGDLDGQAGDRVDSMMMSDETTNDTLSVLTVGANRFFSGHALKFTTDVGIALDEVSGAWAGGSRGYRADADGADAQVVVRAQMQLLF
ncbi:MAG: hypothetical protein AAGG07_01410 [Planctomycetota bacterium]